MLSGSGCIQQLRNTGKRFKNRNIYSKHLEWEPLGEQEGLFAADPPRPVHDDILIAKLSPGQELDLKLICLKGIGRDHAKFSPVCTAFYRFHPIIQITELVGGDNAKKLADLLQSRCNQNQC